MEVIFWVFEELYSFEEEIKELLTSYKFPGDKTPIIKGSALAAVEGKDEAIGKNN